ncbi:MAG: monooxygenase [Alphaproteobacteria bacterium]|jgi:hypothetical protein|nr:monooxygenase [Rhodospirillaceae bacterium]MDP6020867.1 monooxygenase [Alphaproteobacteria bacterium]MDP6254731.1 monooxygenase [Alphaproteobacteria bacterium]MDP7052998.1 monooxygenase [Alphaproteobacteria bacterium]MDP7231116.1 monooxygenase [Alphaproteobacteria bacterium]|tara:strand:+ start:8383 stop:8727 length:345 start_codon:yes stop_codon:yes gene_type:complete
MVITIVQIPRSTAKPDKAASIAGASRSAPQYRHVKGLLRKDFLNGEDGGGGIYLWVSREAAEAWFNDDWWGWIEERFGARPTLTYFDHYLTVDNMLGEIRVDGQRVEIAEEAAE